MDAPRISVAVTNFNGEAYLEECLTAIKAQTVSACEIFVVDNASTDRSLEILSQTHPDVRVVKLSTNMGPGAARNEALRSARHRLLLSVDNDAMLEETCLARLLEAYLHEPDAAIVEPRAVYYSDRTRIHYDGGYLNYLGIVSLRNHGERIGGERIGDGESSAPVPVDAAMAVALLIDREKVGEDDLYDEGFHFYFEDIDFSYRLRLRGHRVLALPSALVRHREGTVGMSYRKERGYPKRRAFYFTRNRWRFALKVLGFRSLCLGLPAAMVYESAYVLLLIFKGHLWSYLKAIFTVFRELPEVLSLRAQVQNLRSVPDRELLCGRRLTFVSTDDTRPVFRVADKFLNGFVSFWWRLIRPMI